LQWNDRPAVVITANMSSIVFSFIFVILNTFCPHHNTSLFLLYRYTRSPILTYFVVTFCGLTRLFNSFVVNVAVKCTFEIACRLSVCLSVTLRYRDHIGWNTSKIILWPNSLRFMLGLIPTWAISSNGNTLKLGWNSLCLSEIIPCVLLTYRVGVHWGVARDCPTLQRTLAAPDSIHRECLSRAVAHVCVL